MLDPHVLDHFLDSSRRKTTTRHQTANTVLHKGSQGTPSGAEPAYVNTAFPVKAGSVSKNNLVLYSVRTNVLA
jgi:hypothetical protein